jgi:hypothetical protein
MIMPLDQALLQQGRVVNGAEESFGCFTPYQLPDGTAEVKVVVMPDMTDTEEVHTLHPGDTFRVRDETWRLESVENVEDQANWRVHIVRVS